MTCTHAALKRRDLVEAGFQYDNILMEESAQILEIETFIPLLLQVSRRELLFFINAILLQRQCCMLCFNTIIGICSENQETHLQKAELFSSQLHDHFKSIPCQVVHVPKGKSRVRSRVSINMSQVKSQNWNGKSYISIRQIKIISTAKDIGNKNYY